MLEIKNLTKRYGNKTAVDALSLHIAPGEIYGFIGHNGAGKTTTLKSVAGILPIEEGDVLIGGISVKKDPIGCKRKIAYIPDNPDLYDYMTGSQYLNFVADVFALTKEARQVEIERLAGIFEMQEALPESILSYSHGMKQKLAIIAAFMHRPELILMDEPFVGLDPLASHRLKELMQEVCREGGAIFFSTHVLDVAEKLCHKVAIIKSGALVVTGTMEEVRNMAESASLEDVFLELTEA